MKSSSLFKPLSLSLAAVLLTLPSWAQDPGKSPTLKVDPAPVTPKPGVTTTFAPVVEKVSKSVVTISTSKMTKGGAPRGSNPLFNDPTFRRFFGLPDMGDDDSDMLPRRPGKNPNQGRREDLGLGSGVIVSAEGHILTNNHVVEGADEIKVKLGTNSHEYKATKIGTDPDADLAVLKIDAKELSPITFADSDKVRVGDVTLAVGNPFGFTQSVTMGIVSALGRGVRELDLNFQNFIQTDASINPGNSGGALVDTDGRLIGINTAIFSRSGGNQGIGFAVPANLARSVMESILKNGRVVRGYLGIKLQPLNDDLAKAFKIESDSGALVGDVSADSPAQKAGLKAGDVVIEVDGKKVSEPRELQMIVAAIAPGTEINVKVLRDAKEQLFRVKLGERPSQSPAEADPDVLDGVTVADLTDDLAKEFEIPANTKGVVVTQIDTDSPSYIAGLRKGDVIHEINRTPVTTAKEAVDLSEKVKKDKRVLLRVSSRGTSKFLVVTQPE